MKRAVTTMIKLQKVFEVPADFNFPTCNFLIRLKIQTPTAFIIICSCPDFLLFLHKFFNQSIFSMEKIIILDFGSQTTQLIGRRLRDLNEYCEIVPYNKFPEDTTDIKGVILSGSPFSVYDPTAFKTDLSNIRGKFPVLGICVYLRFFFAFFAFFF